MLLVPNAYMWLAPKVVTPNAKATPEALPPPHFEPEREPAPAGVS
jgi:hypothetical protein